jgi:sugar phosphate isomerase/epimerase
MRVTRRQFVQQAAGAAAAGLLAPGIARAADRWPMKLSASTIMFSKLPIEKACEKIAELGFDGVDIWSPHAGCPHLDDVQTRLKADGLKELLARVKLKLYAFSVYAGGYRKYADLLGQAGGGVAVRGSGAPCKPEELTAKMQAFLEALKPDAELAEKHNSYLAIENHGHALLDSLDSFKAFVDLNKYPRVGLALAPYHLQSLKTSVEDAIAISGKQLLFFYAWQNAPDTKQLPGHGPTDCAPWLAALAKAQFAWYVSPFMHHEPEPEAMAAALAKSRDYLKECYAKAVP